MKTTIAMALLLLLILQIPVEAKKEAPKTMMKLGDEIVSVEAGSLFVKAQDLLNSRQFDQADALLKQFLETYPNSSAARYKYSYALLQQGKNAEALEQAKLCTKLKPTLFGGWAVLGEASMNLKLEDQAKSAYKKALEIEPTGENADVVRERLSEMEDQKLAVANMAATDSQNAQIAAQNRDIMKINSALKLCDRANELLKEKQFEKGLELCHEALRNAPDSNQVKENVVVYLNNYAANCVQQQNLDEAEKLMKEALDIQKRGGVTAQSQKTTLKNYSAILKFLGREEEAKRLEGQPN